MMNRQKWWWRRSWWSFYTLRTIERGEKANERNILQKSNVTNFFSEIVFFVLQNSFELVFFSLILISIILIIAALLLCTLLLLPMWWVMYVCTYVVCAFSHFMEWWFRFNNYNQIKCTHGNLFFLCYLYFLISQKNTHTHTQLVFSQFCVF